MIYFKSCPRCSGDLLEDSDGYGRYIACLQCGYYLTEAEEVVLQYSHSQQPAPQATEAASPSEAVEAAAVPAS